jgi:TolA-binding protein
MPMDEFVSRVEYDERMKRIEDEDHRQNHRIDKLETITDQIADMAASIKAMVVTMQSMQKEQEEQGKRLSDIEKKPADNWNNLVYTIIAMVATAAITYIFTKGGL